MASKQYTANQFGMSNGDPGKRQERREARQAGRGGGGKSDDNVQVCTKETAKEGKCGAFAGGGPSTGNVQKSNYKKPSSSSRGGKNVVLKPGSFKAKRHSRSLAKVRENAPAMKNLTRKQKETQSQMGPPTPSYVTDKPKKPQPGVTAAARKAAERKANAPAPLPPAKKGLGKIFKRRQVQKITI